MEKKPIIAGNWKLYKTIREARSYIQEFVPLIANAEARIFLAVPFTDVMPVALAAEGTNVVTGAQNMSEHVEGAYTGEVSARMLKESGAQFVILGHSERRQLFHETNDMIKQKVERALDAELTPILCIGESAKERENGQTRDVLYRQLEACLGDLSEEQISKVIVAYEPIWAIGTGVTASPEMAQETHQECRAFFAEKWGDEVSANLSILYGGSVKPETIVNLMVQPDIDGALVGGASLDPKMFATMINEINGMR